MSYSQDDNDLVFASESGVSIEVQREYMRYHDEYDEDRALSSTDLLKQAQIIFSSDASANKKKQLIFLLGNTGALAAYNLLQKYVAGDDADLHDWAVMALAVCRAKLSSEILEQDAFMVTTAAGGVDNILRYYMIFSKEAGVSWFDDEIDFVRRTFISTAEKFGSKIEASEFGNNYILGTFLVPMDVAVGIVAESCIEMCNEHKRLLRLHYFTSNMSKPNDQEIHEYVTGIDGARHK